MPSLSEIHLTHQYLRIARAHGILCFVTCACLFVLVILLIHHDDSHRAHYKKHELYAYLLTIPAIVLLVLGMNDAMPFIPGTGPYVNHRIDVNRQTLNMDGNEINPGNEHFAIEGDESVRENIVSSIHSAIKARRYDSHHRPQKPLNF